jgi:hypothetical protein
MPERSRLGTSQLQRFLFEPASARSATVFRIALAGMLAWRFIRFGHLRRR